MPSTDEALVLRAMEQTDADAKLFLDCFARNGMPRDERAFRWQFFEGPTGRLYVDFAVAPDGTLGAIYAALPVMGVVDGRRVLAVQSVDTLTDERHRGKGLFLQLAKRTYARAAAEGAHLVYGFPNGQSANGFFTRLGWKTLDPVPFLVRPLRTSALTRRLPAPWRGLPSLPIPVLPRRPRPGTEVRAIIRFGVEHEAVWRLFAKDVGVAVDRDAAYLNWRLVDKPGEDYRALALYERGRLLGFSVHCLKQKHGAMLGYLMEVIFDPTRPDAGRRLVTASLRELAARGTELVLAWCFDHSPNRRALAHAGFAPFPERFRPIELHAGVRALVPSALERLSDRRHWYVSYCDSDTV